MVADTMIVTLVSPIYRRWCLWEYFHGIRVLFESNPDITFKWIIHDNSRDGRVKKAVAVESNKIKSANRNVDTLIHHINNKNYANPDAKDRGNVGDVMIEIYNIAFGLADWESDYGMIIEDDVLVMQTDALRTMLGAFDEATGTVSAGGFSRYALAFGSKIVTNHWAFKEHKGGKVLATQLEPKATGIDTIEMTSQCFWLARFNLIKLIGFAPHERIGGADRAWCLRTKDLGYNTKVVWDIKTRHYYLTQDGRMEFVNYNRAKSSVECTPEPKFVRRQLVHPCTVFVTVPDTMTDAEIKNKYKYDVKPEPVANINYSI